MGRKKKDGRTLGNHRVYKNKREREKGTAEKSDAWRKANTKIINIRFRLEEDKDVLAKLDSVPNKADYIRQLILQDIKKQGE